MILSTKTYIGIAYFPKKVLNFYVFCRDNKSWVPFECNPCKKNTNHLLLQNCIITHRSGWVIVWNWKDLEAQVVLQTLTLLIWWFAKTMRIIETGQTKSISQFFENSTTNPKSVLDISCFIYYICKKKVVKSMEYPQWLLSFVLETEIHLLYGFFLGFFSCVIFTLQPRTLNQPY